MTQYQVISITHPNGAVFTIDTNDQTIRDLFDENYFKSQLSTADIQTLAQGIVTGKYIDSYDYWGQVGIKADISPCKFYNRATYLANNSDVKAVIKGQSINPNPSTVYLDSGLQHWLLWGRMEFVNSVSGRAAAAPVPSVALAAGIDNLAADPSIGESFTGTDTTFLSGDIVDGGTPALSSMTLTLAGSPASAGTLRNTGSLFVTSTAASTLDATNISGVTLLENLSSSALTTVSNLAIDPTLAIVTSSRGMTVGYVDTVLTGNTGTVNVIASGVSSGSAGSGSVLTLNHASSGFFQTLNITSSGSATNNLWNHATDHILATSGLAGNALAGTTTLNVLGTTAFKTTIASAVSSIRTITASPVTAIEFIDTTTGTTSNGVTATFASAGSKIGFSAAALATTGNSITFTGAGNTLALKVAAAATTSDIHAQFTHLDSLEVTNTLTGSTINLSNFATNAIKNVYIDVPAAVTAVVNNFGDSTTSLPNSLTIGLHSQTPVAITSLTTTQLNPASTNQLNVNLLGTGAGATQTLTLNGVGATAVYVDPSITGGFSLSLSGNSLANASVTGGLSSSLITFSAIPAGLNALDASASLSGISVTGNNAISTIKGSYTAANTITGGNLADTIVGGAAADTIDPGMGANTVTLHHGESNVGNVVKFSNYNAITTIADFNAGTSSTAVDTIAFSRAPTQSAGSGGNIVKLVKGTAAAVTAAAALVQVVTTSSATTDISAVAVDVIVLNNGQTYANAAALSTYLTTAGTKFIVSAITHATASAMPFFYQNTNGGVGVAIVDFPDAATDSTGVSVMDIATLGDSSNPIVVSTIDQSDIASFY